MPDLGKATFTLTTNSKPFLSGLTEAEAALAASTAKMNKQFSMVHGGFVRAGQRATSMSKSIDKTGIAMQQMGKKSLKAGALVGVGLGFAMKTGMKFDQVMSTVRAATDATSEDFKKLREAALDWGAKTQFSAREVAGAMVAMGKAGFKTQQILGALPGVLDAAAASGESMESVSSIMVNTLEGFGMAAKDAIVVADGLAYAANATTAYISDLGESMKYVAPVAKKFGASFHETNGALVALAKVGIKGSQAGTNLRGVMLSMQAPNKRVIKDMKEMNLSFRDAEGNMLPLADSFDVLQAQLDTMSKSEADAFLVRMFGRENITAAQTFLDIGSTGLKKFELQSRKSKGAAEAFAAILRDNLAGDMEQMSGAAETAAIKMSDDLTPAVRGLVNEVTKLIDAYNSLDAPTRKVVSQLIGATAAFLVVAGVVGVVGGTVVRGVGLMVKAFGPLFKGIGVAIGWYKKLSLAIQTFVAFSGGKMGALGRIFSAAFKPIMAIVRPLVGIFGWVARGIMVAVAAIAAALSVPVWVVAAVVAAVVIAAVAIIKYWDKIKSATQKAWSAVVNFIKAAGSKIVSGVSSMVNTVRGWWTKFKSLTIKDVAYAFGYILGYIIGTLAKIVISIAKFVVQVAQKLASGARAAYNAFVNGIQALPGAISSMAQRAVAFISNMAQRIGSALVALAGAVARHASNIASSFVAAVRALPGQAMAIFQRVTSSIGAALRAAPAKVRSALSKIPGIVRSIGSAVAGAAKSVGKAIIDGIVAGIKAGAGAIKDAAVGAAKGALDGAKNALGIKSPSRVFRDVVGANIPAGIAEGIKKNAKGAVNQMAQLVNAIRNVDTQDAITTIGGVFAASTGPMQDFFNKAQGGLSRYTTATVKAEAAAIKLLARGKQGRQLADSYLKASAALEGMRVNAKAMEAQLRSQTKVVDDLSNAISDLQNIQIAGTKAYSDEAFALDQQMKALELQQIDLKLNSGADDETPEVIALQQQLDVLRMKADQLNLRESLELDPLRRQWEATINPIKEMNFDAAVAQFHALHAQHDIETQKLTTLQSTYESLTAAIETYTAAMAQSLQIAQDIQQQQQQAASQKTANQRKRESLQTQITKAENQLAEWVKKGLGNSTAAKNKRITIANLKKQLAAIPALAKGGIATKPTMAMVGEGAEHEAILPLSKLQATVEVGARRAANFLNSQVGQTSASDGGKTVTIENVEMNFHGEVDPFIASRELTSSLKARMGGLV